MSTTKTFRTPFLLLLCSWCSGAAATEPTASALEAAYGADIRPLLEQYCHDCHNVDLAEADLDLAAMVDWDAAAKQPRTWQKVGEMLGNGLMPPEEGEQPTEAERAQLQAWVRDFLTLEAQAHAGDPGRVVLRRLSNAEYTYTLRDLTGVDSLDPAREFPTDGAAGEGFTNTGSALVMSPALVTKYLDAAKEVASHAVLLPDGFRFSPHTTRRDWTNELLGKIRSMYRELTEPSAGDHLILQGVAVSDNEGGRLPLTQYLAATLIERESLATGGKTTEAVARQYGLNAKYLGTLWSSLTASESSLLLEGLRARWQTAKPEDAAALAAEIAAWQKGLWQFTTVGHIGKVGGPKRWMEPVSPLVAEQEIRFKIPPAPAGQDVTVSLVATDAGDGNEHDFVVWQQPRLVAPGRPDLLLRDVREAARDLAARRARIVASAANSLNAAEEVRAAQGQVDLADVALKHGVDAADLQAWLDYLGVGICGTVELGGHFTSQLANVSGYDFIAGWGNIDTPYLLASSSDREVHIPGLFRPRSVVVHPSPSERVVVGWRSPVATSIRVEAAVIDAHPACGNGVNWTLELRRGAVRQQLASGVANSAQDGKVGPLPGLAVQVGDVVSLSVGPLNGDHVCDLTAVELTLTSEVDGGQNWNLADDVSSNVSAGNPHADRFGNASVWHFYTEPDQNSEPRATIPAGSLLARWQSAASADEKRQLAIEVQQLLASGAPAVVESPDAVLYQQLTSLSGPLAGGTRSPISQAQDADRPAADTLNADAESKAIGLDPALFGKDSNGNPIESDSLGVRAPSVIEIHLPADLAAGCELVTTGVLHQEAGVEGSVQLQVVAGKAEIAAGLLTSEATVTLASGPWTDDNRRIAHSAPILVTAGSAKQKRLESAFEDYRQLFPAALCYATIVPVDEVVTLTLYHREDDHLARLMLDESQKQQLDQFWDELRYVSQDALTLVDALAQLIEFATQDAEPKVFEPLRQPFSDRAAAFHQRLIDTEPKHVEALLAFAARAYRRPLTAAETQELKSLYESLRQQEMAHEEAFRLTLARVLVAPAFLYRIERPAHGADPHPVSPMELASRLSYFLWAAPPDDELRDVAAAGQLAAPATLAAQTQRMLRDPKTRRLATEFACQWLHIRDFENFDEKSERHFPTFVGLRGAMAEESIQFFTDLFQNNGSVLDVLDADYTFLNEELAKHYGIPDVSGAEWRRVDGVKKYSRGGILGHATTLATQSGASRTSPILRGNWISEVLLGERLPRPPKGVPPLPDDGAGAEGLTVRQLVERHVSDPKCAVCHQRIDPYGFSLEGFDAIGGHREKDLGDRPIDARVTTMDGAEFEGIDGLRTYLLTTRREAFLRQFCRKLLGYALGRSVQLSDEPLLTEMQARLQASDYKVAVAVETIVSSRQFREIRGLAAPYDE